METTQSATPGDGDSGRGLLENRWSGEGRHEKDEDEDEEKDDSGRHGEREQRFW